MEFAGRHLFERGGVEHEIHAAHHIQHRLRVAHVADMELQLVAGVALAHVVLLLLVAAEDADLAHPGLEEPAQNGIAKGAGAAGDQ